VAVAGVAVVSTEVVDVGVLVAAGSVGLVGNGVVVLVAAGVEGEVEVGPGVGVGVPA
jgi:hypothetical protein